MHMAADALVTAAVVVSGIAIALTGLLWLDPAVSLVVSGVIVYGTGDLVTQALSRALDAVPQGVDADAVRAHLLALPGVTGLQLGTSTSGDEHDRDRPPHAIWSCRPAIPATMCWRPSRTTSNTVFASSITRPCRSNLATAPKPAR